MAVGGGSGGHVTPVAAVIDELHAQLKGDEQLQVRFVCDKAFEAQARRIMQTASIPVDVSVIQAGKLRRYRHFRFWNYITQPWIVAQNIFDTARVGIGFLQAVWLCVRMRPDVVFAKGGYVCLPVGWAARFLRIPLVLHDSDARPGLTSRLLAPSAAAIATGYPLENYPYSASKSSYVGVPVRDQYAKVTNQMQSAAKKRLGVPMDTPLLVAFGGGLGARSINTAITRALPEFTKQGVRTILIAGEANVDAVKKSAAHHLNSNVEIHGFVVNLHDMLEAADLVVTRASATALQELAAMQKPVIVIPAHQLGDQHHNAEYFAKKDAAIVLTDAQLHQGELTAVVQDILRDESRRKELAKNIHQFARPHATRDVAATIRKAAGDDK